MLGIFHWAGTRQILTADFVTPGHNTALILLSLAVGFFSMCAAFYIVHAHEQWVSARYRKVTLLCASIVLGLGIWDMHFIGMLAMQAPFELQYHRGWTAFSLLPGMVAAWLALTAVQMPHMQWQRIVLSGCLVGLGICVMHYSGIAALQGQSAMQMHAGWFVLSLLCGLGLSIAAFATHNWLSHRPAAGKHTRLRLVLPALLLTAAAASMHYVSMHGLSLSPPHSAQALPPFSGWPKPVLSWVLTAISLLVFTLLGLGAGILRYRDLWQDLATRDARLNAMVDTAVDGVITIDASGAILDYNPAAEHLFGYSKSEVVGNNVSMLMPSPLSEQHDGHLAKHQGHPERPVNIKGREVLGKHKDGRHFPLQLSIGKANTAAGTFFVGYLQDISERKRTDAQLRIAASVFQHVREGVAIVDANHNISDVNPAFLRLMELPRERSVGRSLESLYEDADIPPDMTKLWQSVAKQQYWQSEIMFTRANGSVWVQRLSISPVLNELQRPHHFIAVVSDVTERPGLEVMLPHAELHDNISGLPTEKLFLDRLTNSLISARRKSLCVGVMLFDIQPPAAPGSHAGNLDIGSTVRLMVQVLRAQLRSTDTLARLQPHQLALLLPGMQDEATLRAVARRLVQSLYDLQGLRNKLESSELHMGLVCSPNDGLSAIELMDAAREALIPLPAKTGVRS